jgi:predicted N-acetyltransferase YhbS
MPGVRVRPARESDVPALLTLQAECHSAELQESAACLRAILAHGCSFVALHADAVVGYALAHDGEQAALDAVPAAAEAACSDSWFLHDVAVSATARNSGVARALVDAALAWAAERGAAHAHLVALPGTAAMWARFGFAACAAGHYADAASYGPGATHMRAALRETQQRP